jgi:hypothetical protein
MDLATAVITVVVAGGGAYLGSYLKKKGENWATKEDVKELTRITKEIEAKITNEVWHQQRICCAAGVSVAPVHT